MSKKEKFARKVREELFRILGGAPPSEDAELDRQRLRYLVADQERRLFYGRGGPPEDA